MGFDFNNVDISNIDIINANDLKFRSIIKQLADYVKYYPSIQNALTAISYESSTNELHIHHAVLGIIYQTMFYKQGMPVDILSSFNIVPDKKSLLRFHDNITEFVSLPFVSHSKIVYNVSNTHFYSSYDEWASRNIIDLHYSGVNCTIFNLNMTFIMSYIKNVLSYIQNIPKYIAFTPYIAEHFFSPVFRRYTNGRILFGDEVNNTENSKKFLEYYYTEQTKIYTFKFINSTEELIEFVKVCADLDALTDCMTAFMIIQSIYQAKAYKVNKHKFSKLIKIFKLKKLGNIITLYSYKLTTNISYKELLEFLISIEAV